MYYLLDTVMTVGDKLVKRQIPTLTKLTTLVGVRGNRKNSDLRKL